MSHIQIIKSIPDTPDIISFDEIRKSIISNLRSTSNAIL